MEVNVLLYKKERKLVMSFFSQIDCYFFLYILFARYDLN